MTEPDSPFPEQPSESQLTKLATQAEPSPSVAGFEDLLRRLIEQSSPEVVQDFLTAASSKPEIVRLISSSITMRRSIEIAESYSGPIPSAREIALYKEAYPDAPRIVFQMAQDEQAHRQKLEAQQENHIQELEREQLLRDNRRADWGMAIAAGLAVVILVMGFSLEHRSTTRGAA